MKILEANNICKSFGTVEVLKNVNFELRQGEIHALMGENGAGKSTLAKIIAGVYEYTSGQIFYQGKEVKFFNTRESRAAGISVVFQEFNLFPDLSVAENLFLVDDEYYSSGFIVDYKKMFLKSKELLSEFNMENLINPYDIVDHLSVAQKQIVEIIRAVSIKSKIIILDEPTASLSPNEVEILFSMMRRLKETGVSFIIVSHRITEIYEISDKISVLRDGEIILNSYDTSTLNQNDLIKAMVGRNISDLYAVDTKPVSSIKSNLSLEVKHLSDTKGFLKDISFDVHEGEIFGISGLVGAGRTELLRNIFGLDDRESGEVFIYGEKLEKNDVRKSMRMGLGYVTEDRKTEGLLQELSITINSSLSYISLMPQIILNDKKELKLCEDMVNLLNIKVSDLNNSIKTLSGGNQQKVLLAKWLLTNPKVLLIDEPTRGIDIAAKHDIYSLLRDLTNNNISVVIVSSEIPEIMGLCNRVMILRDGKSVITMDMEETTEEKIGYFSTIG